MLRRSQMRQIAVVLAVILLHGSDVLPASAVAHPVGSTLQAARPSPFGAGSVPGSATAASDEGADRSFSTSLAVQEHLVPGGEQNPVVSHEVNHVGHEHGL